MKLSYSGCAGFLKGSFSVIDHSIRSFLPHFRRVVLHFLLGSCPVNWLRLVPDGSCPAVPKVASPSS
jgi:hypothetical protein